MQKNQQIFLNEIAFQFEEERDDYRSIGGAGPSYKLLRFFLHTFPISTKRKKTFLVFFKKMEEVVQLDRVLRPGPRSDLAELGWVRQD